MDENEQIPYQIDFIEGRIVSGRWKVMNKLGTGAYGVVYSVQDVQKQAAMAALKVELNQENETSMLKIEKEVLHRLQDRPHTVRLFASGKRTDYSFIVITLCGSDLQKLRIEKKITTFSESTMFRVGVHALYAVKQLHEVGYIHRDIKPQNFVVGVSDKDQKMLYLIDYGMVRQYAISSENEDSKAKSEPRKWIIRRARKKVLLRGTMRYCSVNVHKRSEQGRIDDLISLFYMLVEMRMPLPWAQAQREERLLALKEGFSQDANMNKIMGMRDILTYLSSVKYADRPDYKFIYNCLMDVIRKKNFKFSDQYDWDGPVKKDEAKKEENGTATGTTTNTTNTGSGETGNNQVPAFDGCETAKSPQNKTKMLLVNKVSTPPESPQPVLAALSYPPVQKRSAEGANRKSAEPVTRKSAEPVQKKSAEPLKKSAEHLRKSAEPVRKSAEPIKRSSELAVKKLPSSPANKQKTCKKLDEEPTQGSTKGSNKTLGSKKNLQQQQHTELLRRNSARDQRRPVKQAEKSLYMEYSKYKNNSVMGTVGGLKPEMKQAEPSEDILYPTTAPWAFDFKLGDVPSGESAQQKEPNTQSVMSTYTYMK